AMTEATEFAEIYKLEVVEMPTNVAVARKDEDDEVYRTMGEKTKAIVALIDECRQRHQPVLVGTVSIEKSEALAAELKKRDIPHSVLNARYHEQEAIIIAQAGKPGAVTIATNMAGRGTDIQLGGNFDMRVRQELASVTDPAERERSIAAIREEIAKGREIVLKGGGLYVIGTERHESRRIDNQLRGRSGRQGDPGASKFFLSLEDDLMRIFGSQRMDTMLVKLGLKEGEAIIHPWINKALEKAQQKVEARNFDIRKNLLRFDDVMNDQRKVVYEQRRDVMRAEDVQEQIVAMRHKVVADLVRRCIPENAYAEQWDAATLSAEMQRIFGLDLPVADWAKEEGIADEEILTRLTDTVDRHMAEKAANVGPELMRMAEKSILLQVLDQHWKEHLLHLDHLRQGIHLRGYAQRDPLNEYKKEAFELFEGMLGQVHETSTQVLSRLQVRVEEPPPVIEAPPAPDFSRLQMTKPEAADEFEVEDEPVDAETATITKPASRRAPAVDPSDPSTWGKVSRNASCPCGSGKKFKHCHGRA
ncbi:MAG: preprotein translocase subunit SecA, partial [Alphaproteobacteria bacterium]|nr:preprotein translocase subunit SecA [Alphaproteobacteria bacterium]